MPLDIHYAIGNFIRDGLQGGPIEFKGAMEQDITIAALAKEIAEHFNPESLISIRGNAGSSQLPERYVPSNDKITRELGVQQVVDLNEGIRRTVHYERQKGAISR